MWFRNQGRHFPRPVRSNSQSCCATRLAVENLEARDMPAVSILHDVAPNSGNSGANSYVSVGNETFFVANDNSHGLELWKTDGTSGGTVMVKDIAPGAPSSAPEQMTVFDGKLYFTANDQVHGRELWVTDGTEAGTQLVIDIDTIASSSPDYLTVVGNELLFSAYDATSGDELWKFDGTTASMVADLRPGSFGSTPYYLTNAAGTLYFSASNTDAIGRELWKYEADSGVTLVRNIADLSFESGNPQNLFAIGDKLYFSAVGPSDNYFGRELYVSDGTSNGTVMVEDINPGVADSSPAYLANVNGELWFSASTAATGRELFRSDGTSGGTGIVDDFTPGSGGSNPISIVYQADGAFVHFDTYHYIVYFPNSGPGEYRGNNIYPGSEFVAGNGYVYFARANSGSNYELWQINTTTRAVTLVQEINPSAGSYPSALTFANGRLFFTANDGTDGTEPWQATFNPVVSINGLPGGNTGPEGTAVSVAANITGPGSGGPYTYSWAVTKQGAGTPYATGSDSNFSFTPDDNGTYNLSLTVTDSATQQGTAQQAITITNAAPTATIVGAPTTASVGSPIQLTSLVTDPGLLDTQMTYSWVVMNGSTQVATGTNSTFSFTPQELGTYDVTFTATDDDSGSDSDSVSIVVVQAPPTVSFVNGILRVTGAAANDSIAIWQVNGQIQVFATIGSVQQRIFAGGGVKEIVATGGAGNDTISVGPGIKLRATLWGGFGDDTLTGGGGADVLIGGDGNDVLRGGAGNDAITGNDGHDQLFGDLGNDILIGGLGLDVLSDSGGTDLLVGSSTAKDQEAQALLAAMAEWQLGRTAMARSKLGNLRRDNVPDTTTGNLGGDTIVE